MHIDRRGEVSIFDSVPSIARIEWEAVVSAASRRTRACFLVWAQVPAWFERSKEAISAGLDGVEVTVPEVARAEGRVARVCVPALGPMGRGARPGRPS